MRKLVLALGVVAILAGSFFGTLFIFDRMDAAERAEHAQIIKTALEKYRSARGSYPPPSWTTLFLTSNRCWSIPDT
jgi:hypothetical protein